MCTVVNKYRETYDIDITRNGKWGNPFSLKRMKDNLELCLEYYEIYLDQQITLGRLDPSELKGKKLGCVCKPKKCHGDILAEYVNGERVAALYEGERFIAITGSRTITDKKVIHNILEKLPVNAVLVLGGARGVDKIAEDWAIENEVEHVVLKAHWNELGKAAGFIRNTLMHLCSQETVAIWDGKSVGTTHMIEMATEEHPVTVYKVDV